MTKELCGLQCGSLLCRQTTPSASKLTQQCQKIQKGTQDGGAGGRSEVICPISIGYQGAGLEVCNHGAPGSLQVPSLQNLRHGGVTPILNPRGRFGWRLFGDRDELKQKGTNVSFSHLIQRAMENLCSGACNSVPWISICWLCPWISSVVIPGQ